MTDQTNDSIYLEPGSVWRRGKDWRKVREQLEAFVYWNEFNLSVELADPIDKWLDWANHPDTVLVYSPSGNKLPVKPGYVRVRVPYTVDSEENVAVGDPNQSIKKFRKIWSWGLSGVVIFDVRLPTATEPDEVEGVT
jgi:hypothetical protein